ncbi:cell wall-active antibiotics response protein LiaF [Pseudalkalibacillus caeni]|uniref:Cell wall-active antibiotics response protein n=1 Tax=Exobacillus caeni TaxID=2574798 RepID=A0A5R9F646_9BACL|nr:cell wall-active antibiotics response protein LiaF [Pseudalkalibacillus caeni]TLS35954.1 cell wall-active antibiotics response protein [Pseudalkalibacillus caeni]
MSNKKKSDFMGWILLIGIILLLLEISFNGGGLIFYLLILVGLIYIGRKRMPRTSGKILFWIGLISLLITILNLMAFKFFLVAVLLYIAVQFYKSKQEPEFIKPEVKEKQDTLSQEKGPLLKQKPLFENMWLGQQKTPEQVYEWNDINIQCGIGDTVIDLSYTLLPQEESVIVVRNFIGNIEILVPFDVEVSVHHSILAGSAAIFDHEEPKLFNQVLHYHTPDYENTDQKIKIVTSMMVGNLEVKRI